MQIGIFYANLCEAYPDIHDDSILLEKVKKIGYSYIELDIEELMNMNDCFFAKANELGIGFSVYSFTDENCVLKNGMKVENCLEFLNNHNIHNLMMVCASGCDKKFDTSVRTAIIESLNRLCDKAEKYGINVLMEDFGSAHIPCGSCEDMLYFGENIPKLKYTFDTGNFTFFGEDAVTCFEKLKNRIGHIHLKDSTSDKIVKETVTGNGVLPLKRIIELLIDDGYDGTISIEMFGASNSPDALTYALNFANACCFGE